MSANAHFHVTRKGNATPVRCMSKEPTALLPAGFPVLHAEQIPPTSLGATNAAEIVREQDDQQNDVAMDLEVES